MSRTYHHGERRIRVRGVRRPTDLRRLARALIELEYQQAQAEAEAEAEHQQARRKPAKQSKRDGKATDTDRGTP
jgi:flagellar biosynthesis/type III secretory pathway protein FliH